MKRRYQFRELEGSATWDPGSIADGNEEATSVTVVGAALGDYVLASFSNNLQTLTISGYVSTANNVVVVISNNTGGAIDLSSGTVRARVFKQ